MLTVLLGIYRVIPNPISAIVCSVNWRDQFAKVRNFCFKLTDMSLIYHTSEKLAYQIVFPEKVLLIERHRVRPDERNIALYSKITSF